LGQVEAGVGGRFFVIEAGQEFCCIRSRRRGRIAGVTAGIGQSNSAQTTFREAG
jgi:hypothetical protein